MEAVKQWMRIDPLDTLFFKGSESMVAGQNHEAGTVFPPMPSTLIGAIRGAILGQRGVLEAFMEPAWAGSELRVKYPYIGTSETPGFEIVGPLFAYEDRSGNRDVFIPAPAHWFGDLKQAADGQAVGIQCGQVIDDLVREAGMVGAMERPVWVLEPEGQNLKNLHGYLINRSALNAMTQNKAVLTFRRALPDRAVPEQPAVLPLGAIFEREERVGIALDAENGARRIKKGHLYATRHARLRAGATLLVGLSQPLFPDHLDESGILQLGGEQRMVAYRQETTPVSLPKRTGEWAMSLYPVAFDKFKEWKIDDRPRASGPLVRMGGWDMKRKFHKAMTAYFPAGTAVHIDDDRPLPFGFIKI